MSSRWIDTADVAKMVRKALKAKFPGHKFHVRTSRYSGGSSIDVDWIDGPLTTDVDAVLSLYEGASFDGMVDLKSYHDTAISHEDGSVENVHFGVDFIHSSRSMSDPVRDGLVAELVEFHNSCAGAYGWNPITVDGVVRYDRSLPIGVIRARDTDDGEAYFHVDHRETCWAKILCYRLFSERAYGPASKAPRAKVGAK